MKCRRPTKIRPPAELSLRARDCSIVCSCLASHSACGNCCARNEPAASVRVERAVKVQPQLVRADAEPDSNNDALPLFAYRTTPLRGHLKLGRDEEAIARAAGEQLADDVDMQVWKKSRPHVHHVRRHGCEPLLEPQVKPRAHAVSVPFPPSEGSLETHNEYSVRIGPASHHDEALDVGRSLQKVLLHVDRGTTTAPVIEDLRRRQR